MTIIAVALEQLFPTANPETDWLIRNDGAGDYIAQWNRVEVQPTQAELDAAWVDYQLDQATRNNTLTNIRNTAQSAVGVALSDLTTAQQRSLLIVLLWKAKAINKDGEINLLANWVD
jgi:hypothetical protein